MGAPVGSALVGSREAIKQARRVRKTFGGGWRQAGHLAAACIYALDHHVDRLQDDHKRARALAEGLLEKSFITSVLPVETNIVIVQCEGITPAQLVSKLGEHQVLCFPFSETEVRMVTHLEFTDDQLEHSLEIIKKLEI